MTSSLCLSTHPFFTYSYQSSYSLYLVILSMLLARYQTTDVVYAGMYAMIEIVLKTEGIGMVVVVAEDLAAWCKS